MSFELRATGIPVAWEFDSPCNSNDAHRGVRLALVELHALHAWNGETETAVEAVESASMTEAATGDVRTRRRRRRSKP
jgi:hypothetical protein